MGIKNQYFATYEDWMNRGSAPLREHPDYGFDFRAVCFDAQGRYCEYVSHFTRARDEKTYPIFWLWPDQIGPLALRCMALDAQATTGGAS